MKNWILDNCFTKNNKIISWATNKKWFINKNYIKEYDTIIDNTNFLPIDVTFIERIYCILNDITEQPKCKCCDNLVSFRGTIKNGYNIYCSSKCSSKDIDIIQNNVIKNKQTCLIKYGVDNGSKTIEARTKISKALTGKKHNKISEDTLSKYHNIHLENKIPITTLSKQLGYSASNLHQLLNRRGYKTKVFAGSYPEQLLIDYFNTCKINIIVHDRELLNGKELDIYLPDYKIAIEINGLFWHNDNIKDSNHLLEKTIECNNIGIRLLHFYDIEILNKFDIVCSIINNILYKNYKIYGRETSIINITSIEAKQFFDINHIQGGVYSKYNAGLIYCDKLVAVMSISKSRYDNTFELTRFANIKFNTVIGGFSKLLKYLLKTNNIEKLTSYVDLRFFTGDAYKSNGFIKTHQSKPNYYYFNKKDYILESRIKYQKHKLPKLLNNFDINISEYENMKTNGYLRIFDCGNLVYKYNNTIE